MMRLEVKYYAMLRDSTGKKSERILLPDDASFQDLLERIMENYGEEFRRHIFDEQGEYRSFLTYLINGISIHNLNGFETLLKDGDKVAILPPVGGG